MSDVNALNRDLLELQGVVSRVFAKQISLIEKLNSNKFGEVVLELYSKDALKSSTFLSAELTAGNPFPKTMLDDTIKGAVLFFQIDLLLNVAELDDEITYLIFHTASKHGVKFNEDDGEPTKDSDQITIAHMKEFIRQVPNDDDIAPQINGDVMELPYAASYCGIETAFKATIATPAFTNWFTQEIVLVKDLGDGMASLEVVC